MASDNEASCASDPNFAVICSFLACFGESCGLEPQDTSRLQEALESPHEGKPSAPQSAPIKLLHIRLSSSLSLCRARPSVPPSVSLATRNSTFVCQNRAQFSPAYYFFSFSLLSLVSFFFFFSERTAFERGLEFDSWICRERLSIIVARGKGGQFGGFLFIYTGYFFLSFSRWAEYFLMSDYIIERATKWNKKYGVKTWQLSWWK